MAKKHKKPSGPAEAGKEEPEFSRWALFEAQVLAKVKDPEKCKTVIAQRQARVDDDSNEADLVAAHVRMELRRKGQDPDTCCVFVTTAEITAWVRDAIGNKHFAINKTTPYLRALAVPELSYSKKDGVPGWVWRGRGGQPGQAAKVLTKVVCTPP